VVAQAAEVARVGDAAWRTPPGSPLSPNRDAAVAPEVQTRKLFWKLRLPLCYDVEQAPKFVVYVRAVGIKQRARVRIGKEVIDL